MSLSGEDALNDWLVVRLMIKSLRMYERLYTALDVVCALRSVAVMHRRTRSTLPN